MGNNGKINQISGFLLSQVIIIGIIYTAGNVFGYVEAQLFNTYLAHTIFLGAEASLYISIMVVLSAIVGLITNLIFGILSDNTRGRFGRRKIKPIENY